MTLLDDSWDFDAKSLESSMYVPPVSAKVYIFDKKNLRKATRICASLTVPTVLTVHKKGGSRERSNVSHNFLLNPLQHPWGAAQPVPSH